MEGKRKSVRIRASLRDNFLVRTPNHTEKRLGKFSTSDPSQDFGEVGLVQVSDGMALLDPIETPHRSAEQTRPHINAKVLNTIFESNGFVVQRLSPPKQQRTAFQLVDSAAQRAVNDHIAERVKLRLRKSMGQWSRQPSSMLIESTYNDFIEDFELEDFCRQFKCLNEVRTIRIDKEYILRNVSAFFRKKRPIANQDLQFCPELELKAEMERNCRKQIEIIEEERRSLQDRLSRIRDYMRKTVLNENQKLVVAQEVKLIEREAANRTTKLIHLHEKVKRMVRELADTKEKLRVKIEGILQSGVYFESGYGHLYSQVVQAGLAVSRRMLESLLDEEEIVFLKTRAPLENRMAILQKMIAERSTSVKPLEQEQLAQYQAQVRHLRNQLILLEESMIDRIGRLPSKQKHVWSLFGTGSNGTRILGKLNATKHLLR